MSDNTRIEDVSFSLTSQEHHTLVGVLFRGITTTNAKIRNQVISVNNSSASTLGTSNVYGVQCSGTGSLNASSFSYNALKGSTINVYSNGQGNKRGIFINGSNVVTTRDINIYIAKPRVVTYTGSYVGVETNDSSNIGSIQLRTSSIGCVFPLTWETYTASDILQTTPVVITDPAYLASPGIQVGLGVDLVTKYAGSKPFLSYSYPTIIFYGLRGFMRDGPGDGTAPAPNANSCCHF